MKTIVTNSRGFSHNDLERTSAKASATKSRLIVPSSLGVQSMNLTWVLFYLIWVVGLLDLSQDYALPVFSTPLAQGMSETVQSISSYLCIILVMLGLLNIIRSRTLRIRDWQISGYLVLTAIMAIGGAVVGLVKGVPSEYVLGDTRNFLLYLIYFAFSRANVTVGKLRVLLFTCFGILSLKLACSILINISITGELGWRYLLKFSPFFVPMLTIVLALVISVKRHRKKLIILLIVAIATICFAQMRGLYAAALAGIVVVIMFYSKRQKGIFRQIIFISFALAILMGTIFITAQIDNTATSSFGADALQGGLDYRGRQVDMLMTAFRKNWLLGAGFGWYQPDSEGFATWLPRPYLVEMEYVNLLAKLGVIGFSIFATSILLLLFGCVHAIRRIAEPVDSGIAIGLTGGLVGFLVATATNTLYSSIYFHLYVVMILLYLGIAQRNITSKRHVVHQLELDT